MIFFFFLSEVLNPCNNITIFQVDIFYTFNTFPVTDCSLIRAMPSEFQQDMRNQGNLTTSGPRMCFVFIHILYYSPSQNLTCKLIERAVVCRHLKPSWNGSGGKENACQRSACETLNIVKFPPFPHILLKFTGCDTCQGINYLKLSI